MKRLIVFALFLMFTALVGGILGPNPFAVQATAPLVVLEPTEAKLQPWPPPPVEPFCSWIWGPPCAVKPKPTKLK